MNHKNFIFAILLFIILSCGILIGRSYNKRYSNYKVIENRLDSLNKENMKLQISQYKKDSLILVYKKEILNLDSLIYVEKIKLSDISKKYNHAKNQINFFYFSQIDSFFKNRYKY